MVKTPIILAIYTDSRSLYNSFVSLNKVTEKRRLIDLKVLREAYKQREIANIFKIPALQTPADGIINPSTKANGALIKLITTNKITLTPNA